MAHINAFDTEGIKKALRRNVNLPSGTIEIEGLEAKEEIPGDGEIILSEHYRAPFNQNMLIANNVLVLGTPGTGKTRNFVLPNIMSMDGSYIVVDACGEVLRATRAMLEENGYTVKVLNLSDAKILSNQYNPFEYFRGSDNIEKFVEHITMEPHADVFWKDTERSILTAAILCAKQYSGPECANFAMVREMLEKEIQSYRDDYEEDDETFVSVGSKIEKYVKPFDRDADVVQKYNTFLQAPVNTRIAIIEKVLKCIEPFVDLCKGKTIDFWDTMELEKIKERKTAIFVIPDTLGSAESVAVTRAFFSQVYNFIMWDAENIKRETGDAGLSLYVLLDEASSIGDIQNFNTVLTVSRSHKIFTAIVLQDEKQLDVLYAPYHQNMMMSGIKSAIGYTVTMFDKCQCNITVAGGPTIIDRQAIAENELNARLLDR